MSKRRKHTPATVSKRRKHTPAPAGRPLSAVQADIDAKLRGDLLTPEEVREHGGAEPPPPPPVNLGPCRVDNCTSPAVEEINWPNFKGGAGKELYCAKHAEAAKRGEVPR